jgi:hypothetical protein
MHGIDETAWFARDDLKPFGLMCMRMTCRLAGRPFQSRRAIRAIKPAGKEQISP